MNRYLALKGKDKFDISKFTIVGSPTITSDGVASGFSNDNYLSRNITLDSAKIFDIVFKFRTPETITIGQILGNSGGPAPVSYPVINYRINNNKTIMCEFSITSTARHYTNSTFTVMGNTDYYGKISYDKTKVIFYISTNAKDWTIIATLNNISDFIGEFTFNEGFGRALGNVALAFPFTGSIDLTKFKITVDNQTVFTGTKPVHLLERRKPKVWNKGQFTIVGNPSISGDGVASGFSGSDYLTIPTIDLSQADSFELILPYITPPELSNGQKYIYVGDNFNMSVNLTGYLYYFNLTFEDDTKAVLYDHTSISKEPNSLYLIKLTFNINEGYKAYYKLPNSNEWVLHRTNTTTKRLKASAFIYKIGQMYSTGTYGWNGSVPLKSLKITTDNTLVFDGGAETYVYDPSKFTVVGSPTVTEYGILSNCSSTNYVNTQVQLSQLAGKSWAVKGNITVGNEASVAVKFSSTGYISVGSITWYYSARRIAFVCRTGVTGDVNNEGIKISTANNSFEVGDKIYYTLSFDITTGTYSFYADKVNGTALVGTWIATTDNKQLYYINTQPTQYISFGRGSDGFANLTTGSVDMKDFSVCVDGKEVFTGAKESYYVMRK